jgi:hypothetical protein
VGQAVEERAGQVAVFYAANWLVFAPPLTPHSGYGPMRLGHFYDEQRTRMSQQPGILLIGPDSRFHRSMLAGFAKGFAANGCRVGRWSGIADQSKVAEWASKQDIQLIFDLNGMIDPVAPWPSGIQHAKWYQDYQPANKLKTTRRGSVDHTYFLFNPKQFGVDIEEGSSWSYLPPGVNFDTKIRPLESYQCDVSFMGFIPHPVRNVAVAVDKNGLNIYLETFYKYYPKQLTLQSRLSIPHIERAMKEICTILECEMLENGRNIFLDKIIRQRERSEMLEAAISCTEKILIFGPPHWEKWDIFKCYYRGFIENRNDVEAIHRSSKINLHNGTVSFHFRVLESMAAGGFILTLRAMNDEALGEIRSYFEPGEHYDDFTLDTAQEVIKRYIKDDERRVKMVARSRAVAIRNHSWINRASEVLNDFDFMPVPTVSNWDPSFVGTPRLQASLAKARLSEFA